jgi:outer membrane receptor protein involved in Fe transport
MTTPRTAPAIALATTLTTTVAAAVGAVLATVPAGAAAADLNEIVVTARKQEERLQDVPISVTAFRSEDLQERNARDIFDLSNFTPGFSFERINRYGVQGGVSRPVIRGMSNILGEGNASVFVDGILFSDSILSFPFDIVERVEIIKGPQAAQFGRATFSGAINLITKKGTNETDGRVSLRAAQYGDYEANVLSRGPLIEDKLFYMAHARYYTADGMYRNRLDGQKIGGEESWNVNGSLEWRLSDAFSATVNGGYSKDDDDHAAIVLQDRFANNCFLRSPRQYYCGEVQEQDASTLDVAGLRGTEGVNRTTLRLSAQLVWDLDAFSVTSNTGFFSNDTEYGYDSTYQAGSAIAPTTVPGATGYVRLVTDPVRSGTAMRNEVTARDEWSTELRVQNPATERFRYTAGVFYYKSDRTLEERRFRPAGANIPGEPPTLYSGETRVENRAVFGSVGTNLTDAWDVTLELRYAEDEIENENPFIVPPRATIGQKFDSWSPRVTSTYKLTPDNMVYVNVARGNKPGVINADPRFPPDIQFADEESAWSYELGTKNAFGDGRLTANAAVYFIDWSKQQLTTAFTFPTGGTQSYITNAGKSEVRGLELELQAAVTDWFTTGLVYAYTDAEFKELNDGEARELFGNPSLAGFKLPGVPEHQASIFGRASFPVGTAEGFVRGDFSYTSKKYDQVFNLAHTGTKELLNLSAGMEWDAWQLTVFVNNVTDDRTPSSVTRYVDQMNLNVPQFVNRNPQQANVPGTTTLERAFFYPLAAKRQFGATLAYRFGGGR